MRMHQISPPTRSVLATLRRLTPHRPTSLYEALRIAELQANRLLELWAVDDGPVSSEIISELPRISVLREAGLPVSGTSHWSGQYWVITLNADEPLVRQRFTLMHEFKHIIDHGHRPNLYLGDAQRSADEQAELAADYFAGCLLLPKRLLKREWGAGMQPASRIAQRFRVSAQAATVRLAQVGLSEPTRRCLPPALRTPARTSLASFRSAA